MFYRSWVVLCTFSFGHCIFCPFWFTASDCPLWFLQNFLIEIIQTLGSLEFDDSGQISTKIYDKRDDFNLKIINFPNMCSNIPAFPAYGVYNVCLLVIVCLFGHCLSFGHCLYFWSLLVCSSMFVL